MKDIGADDKVAAVPQIPFGDVAFRGDEVGLFDEGLNLRQPFAAGGNISIGRRGAGRHDAKRNDAAGVCGLACHENCGTKRVAVWDMVIGRDKQIHRIRMLSFGPDSGGGHGGGGFACFRFQKDDCVASQLFQLFANRLAMRSAANDDQPALRAGQIDDALDGLLKQGPVA